LFARSDGNQYYGARYEYPMKMFGDYHDPDPKTIVGDIEINNTNVTDLAVRGEMDVAEALDALNDHANAGPFISRLLIQRLVTSNPSRGYVYRVAQIFENNGSGIRGDLKAVTKAILLDYEARNLDFRDQDGYGKVREPILRYVAFLRAMNATTQLPVSAISDWGYPVAQSNRWPATAMVYRYGNTTDALGQAPLRAPTVFNWFLPDYKPGGELASAGLFVPEFQIITESLAVNSVNYFYNITIGSKQGLVALVGEADNAEDLYIDKQSLIDFWDNAPGTEAEKDAALLDKLDNALLAGRLAEVYAAAPIPNPRTIILDNLGAFGDSTAANMNDKVEHALYLMITCPEFMVQK
jgi:hypothetical protein